MSDKDFSIQTSIAPWLSVRDVTTAANFYKAAFNTTETYRLEAPDGELIVAQLAVDGAAFWLSAGTPNNEEEMATSLGAGTIRMVLTINNPDALFELALQAGATAIFLLGEAHGWILGRVADPFGLHWEIGPPVTK